jgi:hypothetical protein
LILSIPSDLSYHLPVRSISVTPHRILLRP